MARDRLSLGVPVFAGLVVGAALVTLGLMHGRGEIDANATVGFLGSVIGTAGAVLGALYVERWKRGDADRRDVNLLEASLNQLVSMLKALGQEPIFDEDSKDWFEHELALVGETRHSMMETDAALEAAEYGRRLSDAQLIVALHRVKRVTAYHLPILTTEVEKGAPRQDWLAKRAAELLTVAQEAQESVLPHLVDTIKILEGKRKSKVL